MEFRSLKIEVSMVNTEICCFVFTVSSFKIKKQKKKKAKRGTIKALCIFKWIGSICFDNKQLPIPNYFRWNCKA